MSSHRPSSSVSPKGKNTNGTEKKKKKLSDQCVPPILPSCPLAVADEEIDRTQTQRNVLQCYNAAVVGMKRPKDPVQCNNEVAVQKKASNAVTADEDDEFPKGYMFCPRDSVLIEHYLQKKILNQPLDKNKIHDVELYKHSPDDLTGKYRSYETNEWYFFTPRDRKYQNGTRPSRSAGNGYWKATGADKIIYNEKKQLIGYKKALVFYAGKPPRGDKSNWIMQEYRVEKNPDTQPAHREPGDMKLDDWVLCKLYKKSGNRNTRAAGSITSEVTGDDDDNDEHDNEEDNSTRTNHDLLESVMASESNFGMVNSYTQSVNPSPNESNDYTLAPLPVSSRPSDFACAETFDIGDSLLPFCDNYDRCMFNPINNGQRSHLSPESISFQPPITMFNPINNSQWSHPPPQPISFPPLITSFQDNPDQLTSLQYPFSDSIYLNHSNLPQGDEILPHHFPMPPLIKDQFKPPTTREHKSMPPTTKDRPDPLFDEHLVPLFRENLP